MRKRKLRESIFKNAFLISAMAAVLSVTLITVYIFIQGTPAIAKIGLFKFIFGTVWKPLAGLFGILPMIITSLAATLLSVALGVIIGLFTAVFMSELAPKWLVKIFRPAIGLLAGIPSVVYGFFGLTVIVPLISTLFGGPGNSLLAVVFILTIMILPTIISISESSLRAVPATYREGSLALGATKIQTIFKVVVPAAKRGVITSAVLGMGRAIGETMAVILVAGNAPVMPQGNYLLSMVRTLTANIALEMGYATGLHQEALFATGVVLFVFIMFLNVMLTAAVYRMEKKTNA